MSVTFWDCYNAGSGVRTSQGQGAAAQRFTIHCLTPPRLDRVQSMSDRAAHIPPPKTINGRTRTVKFARISAPREMGAGGVVWLTIQPIIPHSKRSTDAVNSDNMATQYL